MSKAQNLRFDQLKPESPGKSKQSVRYTSSSKQEALSKPFDHQSEQELKIGDEFSSQKLKNLFNTALRKTLKDNTNQLSVRIDPSTVGTRRRLPSQDFSVKKFTYEVIQDKLDRYKTKHKKSTMTRECLIEFITQEYSLTMSQMSATDAILYCRGPALENSDIYQEDKLISWLQTSMPAMRKLGDQIKPRRLPHSVNSSTERLYISKMGNQGNFAIKPQNLNQSHHESSRLPNMNPNLMKEMNDCLLQCEKMPALRRKVQDTLHTLEESLMDFKAKEGLKASMRAQKRIRDKNRVEEESKEKSIQIMLEQTAVLDSPIRAANLQEVLRKQWCEYRDSYLIMSKLTPQQKNKLNDMIFNRYNDI